MNKPNPMKVWLVLAALLLALAGCAGSRTQESTGEYIDDSVITTKVKSAFASDQTVDAINIQVMTFKGTVQLSGFAKSRQEINRAVELARGVEGVKAVKNSIQLRQAQ